MIPTYTITAARLEDLSRLSVIELAAARLLEGHAPESVLNETTSLDVLKRAQREGRLWVALADDVPVGFAHVEVIEPDAVHLEEIDNSSRPRPTWPRSETGLASLRMGRSSQVRVGHADDLP